MTETSPYDTLKEVLDAEIIATYVRITHKTRNGDVTHFALLEDDGVLPERALCRYKIKRIDRVTGDSSPATCDICNMARFHINRPIFRGEAE